MHFLCFFFVYKGGKKTLKEADAANWSCIQNKQMSITQQWIMKFWLPWLHPALASDVVSFLDGMRIKTLQYRNEIKRYTPEIEFKMRKSGGDVDAFESSVKQQKIQKSSLSLLIPSKKANEVIVSKETKNILTKISSNKNNENNVYNLQSTGVGSHLNVSTNQIFNVTPLTNSSKRSKKDNTNNFVGNESGEDMSDDVLEAYVVPVTAGIFFIFFL